MCAPRSVPARRTWAECHGTASLAGSKWGTGAAQWGVRATGVGQALDKGDGGGDTRATATGFSSARRRTGHRERGIGAPRTRGGARVDAPCGRCAGTRVRRDAAAVPRCRRAGRNPLVSRVAGRHAGQAGGSVAACVRHDTAASGGGGARLDARARCPRAGVRGGGTRWMWNLEAKIAR